MGGTDVVGPGIAAVGFLHGCFRDGSVGIGVTEAAGLYVHIPFCSAICPYCDFAVARGGGADRERFVEALVGEIGLLGSSGDEGGAGATRSFESVRFDTVYFGGGTPSALSVEQLGAIRQRLVGTFAIDPEAEWTIEVNPEDASVEVVGRGGASLVSTGSAWGCRRLDDRALRLLGRRHDAAAARSERRKGSCRGFPVGVGRPDLLAARFRSSGGGFGTLDEAAALGPDHISCYELTIHDGTPFGRRRDAGRLRETGEDERAANFVATHRRLAELGYEGYEVSNFARRPRGSEPPQPEVLAASGLSRSRPLVALLRGSQPVVERRSVERTGAPRWRAATRRWPVARS